MLILEFCSPLLLISPIFSFVPDLKSWIEKLLSVKSLSASKERLITALICPGRGGMDLGVIENETK